MRISVGHRPGRWLLFLAGSALLVLAGCSKSTGTITGKVTLNGVPLKGGDISFLPADGVGSSGTTLINEDGTYTVTNCPVGAKKVVVKTSHLKGRPFGRGGGKPYEPPKDAPKGEGASGNHEYKPPDLADNAKKYVAINMKYEDQTSTPLEFEVTGGKQEYNPDLKP
jgi:hypothetical protein